MVDFNEIPVPKGEVTSIELTLYAAKFVQYAMETDPGGEVIGEMVDSLPSAKAMYSSISVLQEFTGILLKLMLAQLVKRHDDGREILTDAEHKAALSVMRAGMISSITSMLRP